MNTWTKYNNQWMVRGNFSAGDIVEVTRRDGTKKTVIITSIITTIGENKIGEARPYSNTTTPAKKGTSRRVTSRSYYPRRENTGMKPCHFCGIPVPSYTDEMDCDH